jgi:hypothetical protein
MKISAKTLLVRSHAKVFSVDYVPIKSLILTLFHASIDPLERLRIVNIHVLIKECDTKTYSRYQQDFSTTFSAIL